MKEDESKTMITATEFKNNLGLYLDSAIGGQEVVITKNGKPVAVLVSPDEFNSWRETMHIRFDADFMKEIKKGLLALKKEKASLYTLDELFE